jgi:hypothetical protein
MNVDKHGYRCIERCVVADPCWHFLNEWPKYGHTMPGAARGRGRYQSLRELLMLGG